MAATDVILGGNAKLKIGTNTANTDITGTAHGTDAMTMGIAPDDAQVPGGGGVIVSRVGQFVDYSFSFTTYADAATDPLLRAANGQRLKFEYESGVGTYAGEAVATVSKAFQYNPSRIMYTVTMTVDGNVTVS